MTDEGFAVSSSFGSAQTGPRQSFAQPPRWRSDSDMPDEAFCVDDYDIGSWRSYKRRRRMLRFAVAAAAPLAWLVFYVRHGPRMLWARGCCAVGLHGYTFQSDHWRLCCRCYAQVAYTGPGDES